MADIYLRSSDGSDASDGLTWANAKATLAAALTAAGAGGTVYVADGHAETQAGTMTLLSSGTAASPTRVLCVVDTADPEPPTALATTATVTVSGGASVIFDGFAYCYGITFQSAHTNSTAIAIGNAATPIWWSFEACVLELTANQANARIRVGVAASTIDDQRVEWINTQVKFANAGQGIEPRMHLRWTNTASAIQGTTPTTLFKPLAGISNDVFVFGVDLSALASGTNLVDASVAGNHHFWFRNCKLGSSVAITTGSIAGQGGVTVDLVNCDSGDTNYRYAKHRYQGVITQETTIVRTGGASDGTTPISRKMVSSADSKLYSPLVSDPIIVWNETLSSITVTVEVITDNVTLTDKEAWIEVEYLGTSGFPLSSIATDRASHDNAHLGSGTNQTSSSETWTTTGLTTPVKQKLAATFTPAEKGPLAIRVYLAKASTTMYFCPKAGVA